MKDGAFPFWGWGATAEAFFLFADDAAGDDADDADVGGVVLASATWVGYLSSFQPCQSVMTTMRE